MPWLRAALCLSFLSLAVLRIAGPPLHAQEKPAKNSWVHITYMESWDVSRPRRRTPASRRIYKKEENSSELASVIRGFRANCPEITVTDTEETARYFLTVTHKRRRGRLSRKYYVTLTRNSGEVLFSDTTRLFSHSVKAACKIINQDAGMPIPEKEK